MRAFQTFLFASLLAASTIYADEPTTPTPSPAAGIDPDKEQRLFPGAESEAPFDTAFPGSGIDPEDPVVRLARRKYAAAAYASETGPPSRAFQLFKEAAEADPEDPWLAMRAIDAALSVNDLDYAEEAANRILSHDPKETRAMVRLGTIAMYREKFDTAEEWFQKAVAVHPNNTEALTRLAQIAVEIRRDYEKTKEYTGRLLEISQLDLQAMLWNARAHALTGNVEQAADLYDRLLRYRPNLVSQLDDLARTLHRSGKVDDALMLYGRGIAMAPYARGLRTSWESLLQAKGGTEAVLEGYKKLIEYNKNDQPVQELFAEYLARTGDTVRLADLRKAMLREDPTYIPALVDLARMELTAGNVEAADRLVEQALSIGTEDGSVYRMIGRDYLGLGYRAKARELLERAIQLDAKDSEALRLLGALLEEERDYKGAEERFRAATDAERADPEVLRSLAEFYLRRNRTRESLELFQQVLAIDPKDYAAHVQVAELYFRTNDQKGLDLVEQTFIARTPEVDELRYQYGLIAQRFGEFERSRRALEKVVELLPGLSDARYNLAISYLSLGRKDLADRTMEDGLKFAGTDQERLAKYNALLAAYSEESGDVTGRVRATDKLLELIPNELESYRESAVALAAADRVDDALAVVARAKKALPDADEVELELLRALVYRTANKNDDALSTLIALRAKNPDHTEIAFQTAYVAGDTGNIALAEQCYRELIHARKEGDGRSISLYVLASNNLAYLFARRNERLEEALKLAESAMEQDPDSGYILDTYGFIKLRLGELEVAEPYLVSAAKRSPRDAEVHENLGDLYVAQGKLEAARVAYDRASELDPELSGLKEKLASLSGKSEKPQRTKQ